MNTQRMEGAVLVLLLAVSAVSAMLIIGACCLVSGRHFWLEQEQEVRAGMLMIDDAHEEYEAVTGVFFA